MRCECRRAEPLRFCDRIQPVAVIQPHFTASKRGRNAVKQLYFQFMLLLYDKQKTKGRTMQQHTIPTVKKRLQLQTDADRTPSEYARGQLLKQMRSEEETSGRGATPTSRSIRRNVTSLVQVSYLSAALPPPVVFPVLF